MLIAESQPRLMDEGGGLESVTVALAAHGELRLAAKLRVDEAGE